MTTTPKPAQGAAVGHTPGPWYWHQDHAGRTSIRTPDRGNLIVMDFCRKGMQGAEPRFAHWTGMAEGAPRGRMGGILESGLNHADARLIAAAPDLLAALKEAHDLLRYCGPEANEFGLLDRVTAAIARATEPQQ